MKYSTILVAAFAAGAMARAIPDDSEYPEKSVEQKYPEEKYPKQEKYPETQKGGGKKDEYKEDDYKKDEYKKEDYKKDEYKKEDYKKEDYKKYEVKYPKKEENPYVPKKTYEENKDNKHYGPTPYEGKDDDYKKYEEKSCFENLKWKKDVYADDDCEIEYAPKDKEKKKPVKVYVYGCDDYSKPIEECGEDKDNKGKIHWKPKKDYVPSDCKEGKMYRFKICEADDEEKFTWSEEFPVYNPHYYAEKPEEKPEPEKCPPPTVPVYPVEAPAAPAAPAAEAPPAPPAAEAPVVATASNVTEEVAPFTSGSSAIKTSVSFMVGIAALVTFAL